MTFAETLDKHITAFKSRDLASFKEINRLVIHPRICTLESAFIYKKRNDF